MPISNLPWLNTGPSLFLEAVKAGTEAGLERERNELARQAQSLQASLAFARNAVDREQIAAQKETTLGKLAQANAALNLRAELEGRKLDESNRYHSALEENMAQRIGLGQSRLDLANEKLGEAQNLNRDRTDIMRDRLSLAQEVAAARERAAEEKLNRPERRTVNIPFLGGGSMNVSANDPDVQQFLSTNTNPVLGASDIMKALSPKLSGGTISSPATNRFRITARQ